MKFWPVRVGSIVLAIVGCFALQLVAQRMLGDYEQRLVVLAGLYVTLAVSLNLINGITGQFSIGHAAFYMVGAYFTGYLSIHYFSTFAPKVGGPIPWLILMIFLGAAAAMIAGFVVGLPSLRLRGDYLAIVTLGFGEILRIIVQNTEALGGSYALAGIPKIQTIALAWLLAVLCIAVCRNLLKTARGLTYIAVREDEVASAAMGVNVTSVKVTAFMVGAAFAGAAGAVLSHYEGLITPQTFSMDISFIILTMVVLGGTGSITGSVFAAVFLSYLPEYLRSLKGPDGGALIVSGALILAILAGVAVLVVAVRATINNGALTNRQRLVRYGAALFAAFVAQFLFHFVFNGVKALADLKVEAGQLRLVIFAVSLIAIMLIRPEGIFAHHEFSWRWVRSIFQKSAAPAKVTVP